MITPGVVDLRLWVGMTWNYQLLWEDGDPPAPVDLTGFEARMQVRASAADTDVILELDNLIGGVGGITLGGAAGTIDLDLDAAGSADLEPGWYVYDLTLDDNGDVTRLVEGKFAIIAAVTR